MPETATEKKARLAAEKAAAAEFQDKTVKSLGTFSLDGEKVSLARSGRNLVMVSPIENYTTVIIPNLLGLKEGQELLGECELQEVTYFTNAKQEVLDEPIVRCEMRKYRSAEVAVRKSSLQLQAAVNMKRTKALESIELTEQSFANFI